MNTGLNRTIALRGNATQASARWMLSVLLLLGVGLFGCWLVGTRGLDVGTDTSVYATFFQGIDNGPITTRLEPGFVFVTYLLSKAGLDVTGYQAALFALMLVIVWVSSREYFRYLGGTHGYWTLLSASLMLLFISPMFVNATINAIRQGLAAPLVFAALLSFQRRKWWRFALYGALSTSLHLSALLYLACAPVLLANTRVLRYVAVAAVLVYSSGLSMLLVRALLPELYVFVMQYSANPDYQSGTRIDFAVFSFFWYALPLLLLPLVRRPFAERISASTSVYLVMLLPFFAVGWGSYSNRYLLPAWLAVSLILAAVLWQNRSAVLRNPLLIRLGLIASCGVYYFYVTHKILI